MDQKQVDPFDVQAVEAVVDRRVDVFLPEVRPPQLRGQEDVTAIDIGGVEPLADAALVVVRLCRVDVAVSQFEGGLDRLRALRAGVLPCAQSHGGNSRTARLHVLHGRSTAWPRKKPHALTTPK